MMAMSCAEYRCYRARCLKLQRPFLAFYPSMCSVEFQWILFAYVVLHLKRYDGFPWLTPQKYL